MYPVSGLREKRRKEKNNSASETYFQWSGAHFDRTTTSSYRQGARETDYPAGEEVSSGTDAGQVGDGGLSTANGGSEGGDSILGGITVVGCDGEGATAVPQIADSSGKAQETSQSSQDHISSSHNPSDPPTLTTDSRPAEEAMEAMETSAGPVDHSESLRGIYTEHVFTDPLGAQQTRETPANYSQR